VSYIGLSTAEVYAQKRAAPRSRAALADDVHNWAAKLSALSQNGGCVNGADRLRW